MRPTDELVLGVDIGGTFTDVLAFERDSGRIVGAVKLPSSADAPARAATDGIDRVMSRTEGRVTSVFHGTTIGTNTLIQKRGARTALIATKGFRDVVALRRQARPRLYDLEASVSPPLVPRELRLELDERIAHDGSVVQALDANELDALIARLRSLGVDAVAIALLHSYANDTHERAVERAVASALPHAFVSCSSDVVSEFREFERTSTVVVNAYIGPSVSQYFGELRSALGTRGVERLALVRSNGGVTSAGNAARYPVHLIESGPAAGVIATAGLARHLGEPDLIAFDMGGTTAKVGVVAGGRPRLSTEFYADRFVDGVDVGGYPIQSPVVDLIEIGAGGGSIAGVDALGVLHVGPASAGAEPGPACYGRGGAQATITDAHVVLGHIASDGFVSEDLVIDAKAAAAAIERDVAAPLGWGVARAAWGVLRLATANMAEMVRLATLRRGLDPRDFALVAFGGGGGLHAAEIAREVGIPRVIVPPLPGLFSALGSVLGDVRHDLVQSLLRPLGSLDVAEIDRAFAALERRAAALAENEDLVVGATWQCERWLDLRFERQLFELAVAAPSPLAVDTIERAFRRAHLDAYGYDLDGHGVELINVRLVARHRSWTGGWPRKPSSDGCPDAMRTRSVLAEDGTRQEVAIVRRGALARGEHVDGPAVVEDFGATVRILERQRAEVHPSGALIVEEHGA